MASSDILSQTLSAITAIKLEELTSQRALFEEGKKDLLNSIDAETSQVCTAFVYLPSLLCFVAIYRSAHPKPCFRMSQP